MQLDDGLPAGSPLRLGRQVRRGEEDRDSRHSCSHAAEQGAARAVCTACSTRSTFAVGVQDCERCLGRPAVSRQLSKPPGW